MLRQPEFSLNLLQVLHRKRGIHLRDGLVGIGDGLAPVQLGKRLALVDEAVDFRVHVTQILYPIYGWLDLAEVGLLGAHRAK